MSLLYRSLQKLRRQDNQMIPVPSFISEYRTGAARKRYFRIGLISLGLIGMLTIPVLFIQSRLDDYQKSLYISDYSQFAVDETPNFPPEKQEEPVNDSSQPEIHGFHDEGIDLVSDSRPVSSTPGRQEQPALGRQDNAASIVSYQYPERANHDQKAVLPGPGNVSVEKKAAEYPDGYSLLQLDKQLEEHFSRKAERNRRAMALNREMENAFASGDYDHVYESLSLLRDVLPRISPLVLKWEGILAMQNDDFEIAREKFLAVLHHSPEDHTARANLALALVKLDQSDQARQLLRELMIHSPDNPMIQTLSHVLR